MILYLNLLYICSISTSFSGTSPAIVKLGLKDRLKNMLKCVHKIILRAVDGALYGFIGPFSILYIIPRFLMTLTKQKSVAGFGLIGVEIAGIIVIWLGAALAVWCTILMIRFGKGTPLVTSAPQKILNNHIYAHIRHPMMWSLIFVVFGQALLYGQIILLVWLVALSRILHLIVVNYEEPQLERKFGKSWETYSQEVPRWFPRFKKGSTTVHAVRSQAECEHSRSLNDSNKQTS